MNFIKAFPLSFILLLLAASFISCSSSKKNHSETNNKIMHKLEESTSFSIGESYYKHWVAGVKGGGSGITLYIPITNNKNNIVLDRVYFRGMQSKLETTSLGYIANFITSANTNKDIIMSNENYAEYGNQLPNKTDFPFQLKDNECVISYIETSITKYYKIENLTKKPQDLYPTAPPRQ